MKTLARSLSAVLALMTLYPCIPAQAADVRVLSTIAFERVFENAGPALDRASGHSARVEFGTATAMANRVLRDEPADVYIGPRQNVDALVAAGKARRDSVVDLARSPIGLAVRKGAPRPDISTPAALRRAILAARGVTFPDPAFGSPSGLHFTRVAAQLGISEELKARTRRPPDGTAFGPSMLISGEADLALQQTSELLIKESEIDLLGPLPPEFQLVTIMSAAVPVAAHEPDAGRTFIRSLQSPAAGVVMKRWGLEPIAQPADFKVLSTIAFEGAFKTLVPEFNRTAGHVTDAEFGGAGVMLERVQKDEVADLYFGPRETVDALVAAGKVRPGSVVDLVRSPMGIAVRKGAPKPDISTAAGLKRVLLAAKGITYPDPNGVSPSARQLVKIAARLGISEELKARTRRPTRGTAAGPTMLITGEVDLAVQQNCELLTYAPDIELLGPLPREFQLDTIMSAAVPITARDPSAARALIQFLQTPAAAEVMRRWSLEPIERAAAARAAGR
jgi:molybdate transport system substrate-binding protein